jgi:hypothetical protein
MLKKLTIALKRLSVCSTIKLLSSYAFDTWPKNVDGNK